MITSRRLRALCLPLAPRPILPVVLVMIAGVIIVRAKPTGFVEVGGTTGAAPGRLVGVFEGVPLVISLALTLALAPRLPQWDRFGTTKTRRLAVAVAVAVAVISCGYFLLCLASYPSWGDPPAHVLRPVMNNVAAAGLLAVITVGTLGRLGGTVAWVITMYAAMWAPTHWPSTGRWIPLNLTRPAGAALDLSIHWGGLLVLTAAALATAFIRRLVPIEMTIRPAEERQ